VKDLRDPLGGLEKAIGEPWNLARRQGVAEAEQGEHESDATVGAEHRGRDKAEPVRRRVLELAEDVLLVPELDDEGRDLIVAARERFAEADTGVGLERERVAATANRRSTSASLAPGPSRRSHAPIASGADHAMKTVPSGGARGSR
jgi:hypothetical protein